MARQIVKNTNYRINGNTQDENNFRQRLIKMIPGEIVAAYLACNTAIAQFGDDNPLTHWIVFGIMLALTPFYLKKIMGVTDPVQIIIMTIAFVLWTMTLKMPFADIFEVLRKQQLFSTLALTIFTFTVPIFYKGN
jgi:hypothetical protein